VCSRLRTGVERLNFVGFYNETSIFKSAKLKGGVIEGIIKRRRQLI
jgi:hypothetical protein